MIRIQCDNCGSGLRVTDDLAGTVGECPKCQSPVHVPKLESPAETPSPPEAFDPMDVLTAPEAPRPAANANLNQAADDTSPAPAEPVENTETATGTASAAASSVAAMQSRRPIVRPPSQSSPKPKYEATSDAAETDGLVQQVWETISGSRLYMGLCGLILLTGGYLVFAFVLQDRGDRVPVYPVKGRVVFPDGTPVRLGTIELESTVHPTTSTGRINEDGTFVLGTYATDDGAPEGPHNAIVMQMVIDDGTAEHVKDHGKPVDPRFASPRTSGLSFEIQPGENDLLVRVKVRTSSVE